MMETWHPLGPVGVISAFNFPVAVWSWNAALAFICGDPVIWKPSEKTPLTAMACQALFERALERFGEVDPAVKNGLSQLLIGGRKLGELLVADKSMRLISATGSCAMGRAVGPVVANRLGRSLLELGGNNAMFVAPSADLDLATRTILFSAVGTAGQRCTSLRRLIIHTDIREDFLSRLKRAYQGIRVGSPLETETLVGPLIDGGAYDGMQAALTQAVADGGTVTGGELVLQDQFPDAFYVQPAIVDMPGQTSVARLVGKRIPVVDESQDPILGSPICDGLLTRSTIPVNCHLLRG